MHVLAFMPSCGKQTVVLTRPQEYTRLCMHMQHLLCSKYKVHVSSCDLCSYMNMHVATGEYKQSTTAVNSYVHGSMGLTSTSQVLAVVTTSVLSEGIDNGIVFMHLYTQGCYNNTAVIVIRCSQLIIRRYITNYIEKH